MLSFQCQRAIGALCVALLAGCQPQVPSIIADLPTHAMPGDGPALKDPPVRTPPGYSGKPSADWRPVAAARPWKWIVVHHSATETGSAAEFDREHKARNWDELGYHFVIDNGNGAADGLVEVGSRWPKQKWGAHCKTPDSEYNDYGIGICLVGDFTRSMPTPGQLKSLRNLLAYLMAEYRIDADHVIGHRDAPGTNTECPGDAFHGYLHSTLVPEIAADLKER